MCQNVSNSSFFTPTLDNCFGVGTLALLLVAIFTRINFTVSWSCWELKVTGFCNFGFLAPRRHHIKWRKSGVEIYLPSIAKTSPLVSEIKYNINWMLLLSSSPPLLFWLGGQSWRLEIIMIIRRFSFAKSNLLDEPIRNWQLLLFLFTVLFLTRLRIH